jgi:hypothetical protein
MIPLFKSHYSIGKSILNLSNASEDGGSDSIISIAKANDISNLVLVEDSLGGFLEAYKACENASLNLIFGLRIKCSDESGVESQKDHHKIIIFPRTKDGVQLLSEIYSESFVNNAGRVDMNFLNKKWSEKHLKMFIPFYDSFIHYNILSFNSFVPDLSFTSPTFFIEDNGLPFDFSLKSQVESYCSSSGLKTERAKSIFYKNKSDFNSFVTYKLICGRKNFPGSGSSLEKPNLDHLGSDKFCWESFCQES